MITTSPPAVPEQARFCLACDGPVGRGRAGRPGPERGVCRWCGTPFDLRPARSSGDVVDGVRGSYRVTAALLHGSRGWIYAASDVATDAPVVLTRLEGPEGRAAGNLAVEDTEVLLELDVPGLVHARDVVSTSEAAGPARHLVLDHVTGVGLDALRGGGPLPPVAALDAAVDAAAVLAGLHDRGLLHTDLTPGNLRRTPADGVIVMDLGSLRRADDHASDVWGTTGFLAPEITPGGAGPSVASEVYGLARTVAVLVADFDHLRSYALRLPDPASVRVLADHPALADLLQRATHVDPAARHTDVTAFAEEAKVIRDDLARCSDDAGLPPDTTRPERRDERHPQHVTRPTRGSPRRGRGGRRGGGRPGAPGRSRRRGHPHRRLDHRRARPRHDRPRGDRPGGDRP